jgi:hypothetical protein
MITNQEAWKGKFFITCALREWILAESYLGSTEPGDPLTKEEYQAMRKIKLEMERFLTKLDTVLEDDDGEQVPPPLPPIV